MITTKCDDCQRQGLLGDVTDFPGYRVRSADPHAWLPLQRQGASHSIRFFPKQEHRGPDRVQKKTLPKAQRTRGLSSSYQSNFLRSYHKFKHKS